MTEQLTADIQAEKAAAEFAELQQELSNVAFSAGSIEEVADIMSLAVAKTDLFSRIEGNGIALNADVRRQAFEDAILLDREISPVIETADAALVFAVVEHQPSEVKALADIKTAIVDSMVDERASELAKERADAILAGGDAEWLTVTTKFNESSDAPRSVQQKAFELTLNDSEIVTTPGGRSVVVVDNIAEKSWQDMQLSDELVESGRTQQSRSDMLSYQAWAKENTEITRSGS